MFRLTPAPICPPALNQDAAGGYVTFDGRVRNHNEGRPVERLEYEAFVPLAEAEGQRILDEATAMFDLIDAHCVHRTGLLEIGESAVWIGVAAAHRGSAFLGCEYIIDQLKQRVPIWKKEHYADGPSEWIGVHQTESEPEPTPADFYRRQIIIPEVGPEGQEELARASVLVVGAGGLGCAALPYLAAAGIGRIGISDSDNVELSNLHRQVLFGSHEVDLEKSYLAAGRIIMINPFVEVRTYEAVTESNIDDIIAHYDIVVDGTDNFAAKFLLNEACVRLGRILVQASLHRFEGQLLVVNPSSDGGCLRCLWPDAPYDGCVGTCAESGVLGVVPGLFGVLQANEVIKLILGLEESLSESLLTVDLRSYEMLKLKRSRRPECPCCGSGIDGPKIDIDYAKAKGMRIIDIRDADEEGGPGFERLPRPLLGRIDQGPVCLVCQRGSRSAAAARELRSRGIEAFSLIGGIEGLRAVVD